MKNFHKEDVIIVTGASSGIGQSLCWKLNEEGATIIAVARSVEKLKVTKDNAKNPETIHIEPKDLSEDVDSLPLFVKSLREKYGKLKAIACVAGIDKVVTTQMLNQKDINEIFTLNYTVPMLLTKGFTDKRNNIGKGANILFIASISGVCPDKGQIVYGASKAALIAAMKSISKEIASRGMRCNCISPAWVETPMFEQQKELIGVSIDQYPLGIGKPEDVSNLGAFLMSDNARWITASNYIMSGGIS